jgi:hypothetical protein
MGIDHFEASARGDVLLREIGFTSNEIVRRLAKVNEIEKEFMKNEERGDGHGQ